VSGEVERSGSESSLNSLSFTPATSSTPSGPSYINQVCTKPANNHLRTDLALSSLFPPSFRISNQARQQRQHTQLYCYKAQSDNLATLRLTGLKTEMRSLRRFHRSLSKLLLLLLSLSLSYSLHCHSPPICSGLIF